MTQSNANTAGYPRSNGIAPYSGQSPFDHGRYFAGLEDVPADVSGTVETIGGIRVFVPNTPLMQMTRQKPAVQARVSQLEEPAIALRLRTAGVNLVPGEGLTFQFDEPDATTDDVERFLNPDREEADGSMATLGFADTTSHCAHNCADCRHNT